MGQILRVVLNSLRYLIMQGVFEILLIAIMEYAGIKVLDWFSPTTSFIENFESISWSIGIKTGIFLLPYSILFTCTSILLTRKKIINSSRNSIMNMVLNVLLFTIYFKLRNIEFSDVQNLFFVTLLASAIIVLTVKIIGNKERKV